MHHKAPHNALSPKSPDIDNCALVGVAESYSSNHRTAREPKSGSDSCRYLTPPEIAQRYGCKPETVVGWIRNGELAAINLARCGSLKPRFRVSPQALADFELRRSVIPKPPPARKPRKFPNVKRFI